MKEITGSPFWLTPLERMVIRPKLGPAVGDALVDHLAGVIDGVADIDRLQPFEIAEAERGADGGDRLAARARLLNLAAAEFDHQPHPGHRGVPAGGAERAEMRFLRRRLVQMEQLRIEALQRRP